MDSLEQRLKQHARSLGFDRVGIAAAGPARTFEQFQDWLSEGNAGEMAYLERNAGPRRHPESILAGARSVIMGAVVYRSEGSGGKRQGSEKTEGKVARYARNDVDYHKILWGRLGALLEWLRAEVPGCEGRAVVDSAPLLERDFARRAGLGWFGKNTMLIDTHLGSYFFLGALLVSVELAPDPPFESSHCGTCTACLDACPTQAFPAAGVLDARRCISYLTIELKGPIPEDLRPGVGDWLFGCDVCQEVCPWNRKAPASDDPAFRPRPDLDPADLLELLSLSDQEFRQRFRDTALWRPRRRGILRNACVVLGNHGNTAALPALRKALDDPEPLVREAAAWAIARISGSE
jgi:epoxyqueuosine reductase